MKYENCDWQIYRIAGISADGSRHVIGEGLNRDVAAALFVRFMDSSQFPALAVEHEPEKRQKVVTRWSRRRNRVPASIREAASLVHLLLAQYAPHDARKR